MARKYITNYVGQDTAARAEFEQLTHTLEEIHSDLDLYFKVDASNGPITAGFTVQGQLVVSTGGIDVTGDSILDAHEPHITETSDIGTQTKRYGELFGSKVNVLENVAGTAITPTLSGAYFMAMASNNSLGGTIGIDVGGGSTLIGKITASAAGSTANVDGSSQGLLIGEVLGKSNDTHGDYDFKLHSPGCTLIGHIEHGASTGSPASATGQIGLMQAGGNFLSGAQTGRAEGCIVAGKVLVSGGGIGRIICAGNGALDAHGGLAQGFVESLAAASEANIKALGLGASAVGFVHCNDAGVVREILASGHGALAHGVVRTDGGSIEATGQGAIALGATLNNGTLKSNARGSMAGGRTSTADIGVTTGSHGSIAWGNTTSVDILAQAQNCQQFGPGTNPQANSLQQGISGTGIAIKGTDGVFTTPANGQVYNDSGVVTFHSGGVAIAMAQSSAYTTSGVAGAPLRTLADGDSIDLVVDVLATLIEDLQLTGLIA